MNKLAVSVVIPSYNRFEFLLNSLASVQNQTIKNLEIIVVNDGSSQKEYYDFKFDENIKIIHLKKTGSFNLGSVRNAGVEKAKGEYIAFLDDDDYWFPNKLERQLDSMSKNSLNFSCTEGFFGNGKFEVRNKYKKYNSEYFYKKIKKKYQGTNLLKNGFPKIWDLEFLKIHNCIVTSSVVVHKSLINSVGGFQNITPTKNYAEDYDCWLKILNKTNLIYVDEPLFYYDGSHGDGRKY